MAKGIPFRFPFFIWRVIFMFKVSTAEQMRKVDKLAIEEGHIPGIILMENAAIACISKITKKFYKTDSKAAIFCGKGNNGGDGFAIARHLSRLGYTVDVFPVCGYDFSPDAQVNFDMLCHTDCNIRTAIHIPELEIPSYDFVVDAIFGTGISGNIEGSVAEIIENINEYAKFVYSVDVPSGLNCDTGTASMPTIKADATITLAAYKFGQLTYPGASFCGYILPVDIGIPKIFTNELSAAVIDMDFVKLALPKARPNTQKGDYGKVLVIAGSLGMTGAAVMAANSALYSGSGIVTIAAPEAVIPILAQKTTEVMTIPLPSKDGHLSSDCISKILEILPNYDSVLFGPGLGRSEDIVEILRAVTAACEVPLIIDADGLFALAYDLDMIQNCKCEVILTPHEMEMSRLMKCPVSEISENRFSVSRHLAEEIGISLILKGPKTIVTSSCGVQYINIKGNPGMATAGSGDCLAGIVASLSARGMIEEEAAACAVYIHACAGDYCKNNYGTEGVTACRIMGQISKVFKRIFR